MDWYYVRDNKQLGPISEAEFYSLLAKGDVSPKDLVWRVGMTKWQRADTIQGLLIPPPIPIDMTIDTHALDNNEHIPPTVATYEQEEDTSPTDEIEVTTPNAEVEDVTPTDEEKDTTSYRTVYRYSDALDNSGSSSAARFFLVVTAIVSGMTLLLGLSIPSELGTRSGMSYANAYDKFVTASAILYLATAIPFIIWLRKAYCNLRHLGATDLKYSPNWALWSWFIPIINLFRPYQVVREVWIETSMVLARRENAKVDNISSAIVAWWWFFFLAMNLLSSISGNIINSVQDKNDIVTYIQIGNVGNITAIIGSIIAINLIAKVSNIQSMVK